jgi:HPt (histidine-containing phosphotransfer) domain-containing protein
VHFATVAEWWRAWHGATPLPAEGFKPEKWRELKMSDSIGGMAMALGMASIFEALKDQALRMVEQKNQELASLFDNMRQAIFTFGPDMLVVGQYSGQAKKVFKRDELAGEHVLELLFKDAPEYDPEFMMFQDWLKVVFSTTPEMWDEMAEMVPKERVLNEFTDEEMHLAVEVRPIISGGKLSRIMVLASDETEKVRIAREAAARDAEHNKEMAAMKKLLSGGAQLFIAFMQSARDRLDAFEGDLGASPREVNAHEVEVLFQHAHTVKGEAKAFELADLEGVCHELEERLTDLREPAKEKGTASTEPVYQEIVDGIAAARQHIANVRQKFIDQSPIGALVLEQISVNRGDVEALEAAVQELQAAADGGKMQQVSKIAARLASRPFGEAVSRLQDGIPAWAAQLEKRANFIAEGKDVLIPPGLMKILPGCLTHMVRNCLAHGIENPEKREEVGKDPCGQIRVTCMAGSAGPNILVEDDGGGLKLDRLREKAKEQGLSFQPGREWELIFASGMSTTEKVDDISGRGVGMAAVKSDIEKAGYELDVHSTAGKGTMFIIRHTGASKRTIPPPAFLVS